MIVRTYLVCLVRPPECAYGKHNLAEQGHVSVEQEDHGGPGTLAAPYELNLSGDSEEMVIREKH